MNEDYLDRIKSVYVNKRIKLLRLAVSNCQKLLEFKLVNQSKVI